jgi:hypothetical protein
MDQKHAEASILLLPSSCKIVQFFDIRTVLRGAELSSCMMLVDVVVHVVGKIVSSCAGCSTTGHLSVEQDRFYADAVTLILRYSVKQSSDNTPGGGIKSSVMTLEVPLALACN